nr:DUF1622 domain-containing protein [Sphingosinicella sp. YJ22]
MPHRRQKWALRGGRSHCPARDTPTQLARGKSAFGREPTVRSWRRRRRKGVILATLWFVREGRSSDWRNAYERYRANLGRGILLGLELLVGADIIGTITAPLTLESVGLLGIIVVIRTLLSFSLETEIEGCWPWQRHAVRAREGASPRVER